MKKTLLLSMLVLLLPALCLAETDNWPQQIPTTSWPGLTGLYMIPTARIVGPARLAIGFNEAKHAEFVQGQRFVDRQIRGVGTYGITDKLEVSAAHYNNMYTIPPGVEPDLHNQTFQTVGAKLLLMREHPHYWFPAIAVAVRDITDDTADTGPLRNVNNGRKFYLLLSKRLLKNERIGRFMDVHAGATWDRNIVAGLVGFELTLAPNASLIVESMWDSPFLNFRDFGQNNAEGRYVFNVGIRMYPELVPGLVLDTGFIGDGEFEFSFGASYVIRL